MIKKLIFIISASFILSGCFDKEIQCSVNGLEIKSDFLGLQREVIVAKLGHPTNSDLGTKLFDEYIYDFDSKAYGLVVRYTSKGGKYYVSSYKCIRLEPKIEVFNHVIWH